MNRSATGAFIAAAVLIAGLGCSKQKQQAEAPPPEKPAPMMAEKEYMVMGAYVNEEDSLPRLRYYDGEQVSLNDRCAVRHVKLNPKMPPIYVNGQPVGFC
jgi:hypothetical protein